MPAKTAANDVAVTASSTETSVADLQRELQRVRQERDDLARDVEALCMSGADPTGISTSSVVSERIRIQDEQLADCRLRLEAALADAASLREDLTALRESKRIADQSWRAETARAANLERELQFYQTQSARAMSDRDRATWEADELKRRVGDLEQSIERERGLRIAEEAQRQQADAALAVAREQAEGLRAELAQLEALPALRQEVARLQDDVARLQDDVARAQVCTPMYNARRAALACGLCNVYRRALLRETHASRSWSVSCKTKASARRSSRHGGWPWTRNWRWRLQCTRKRCSNCRWDVCEHPLHACTRYTTPRCVDRVVCDLSC